MHILAVSIIQTWASTFSAFLRLALVLVFSFQPSPPPLASDPVLPQNQAALPQGADPLAAQYPESVALALGSLARAVAEYDKGAFESTLKALPDQRWSESTAVGDAVLLYRSMALVELKREKEALVVLHELHNRYPGSPLPRKSRILEGRALIAAGDADGAIDALSAPEVEESAALLYWRARAHELAQRTEPAIELYWRVFAGYPTSEEAEPSQKRLAVIQPGYLTRKQNYSACLERADRLMQANGSTEARKLLTGLANVAAPDDSGRKKRTLLLARANLNLRRNADVLQNLRRFTSEDPALQAQAFYLEAAACRRLGRETAFLAARDRAVRSYPDSPFTEELLYSVATYYDVEYKPAQAAQAYRLIAGMFPQGVYRQRAVWKLAVLAFHEGRYDEAFKSFWDFLCAETSAEALAAPLYWMARCCEASGDPGKADYLYRRAQELGNRSYYGQRAAEAEMRVAGAANDGRAVAPIDFDEVVRKLRGISVKTYSMPALTEEAVAAVARAGQLTSAGLPQPALEELRWRYRRMPGESALVYAMARIHASKEDHFTAISTLRQAFPGYASLATAALPPEVWELFFPLRHWTLVSQAADKNGLDPNLIMGLIRQESAFNENARSGANARGLMQILPGTALPLARQARIPRYSITRLYQPETNIVLGSRHLASLLQRYPGKAELALAAYNAGEKRVDRWAMEFGTGDMAAFVELIPFSETRAYIKQVLTNQAHYGIRTASASTAAP